MLLAFDDTDSAEGGCTTHLVFEVLLHLPDLALQGMPRLVRLNPNVPYKTRGNGAVVLPLCRPTGPQVEVGEFRGRNLLAFPDGEPVGASQEVLDRVFEVVSRRAQKGASPAVLALDVPPSPWAYVQAVRTRMEPEEAEAVVAAEGGLWRGASRGLVGAVGAASWPGPPASYEFIAYREPRAWGTPRALLEEAFRGLDRSATFHSWDPEADRPACIPRTPCPVLCGLRGRDPETLRLAATRTLALAAKEPIDGWLLWATNQASGDHVQPVQRVADAPVWGTIETAATVMAPPKSGRGGHVTVTLEDAAGVAFEARAFEPTKSFREVVRSLRPDDQVTVTGAWKEGSVQLERLTVHHVAPAQEKGANPLCTCGKRMKSAGASAGFRCPACGTRADEAAAPSMPVPRDLQAGTYEVPVVARRHLHRPAS